MADRQIIDARELDEATVEALCGDLRGDPPRTDPELSWLWWSYGKAVLEPVLTGWTLERRVPDLSIDNTLVDLDPDGFRNARMLEPSWTALDTTSQPGDLPCGSEAQLFGRMVTVVIDDHLDPIQRWLRAALPGVSLRILWGNLVQSAVGILAEASLAAHADRDRVWHDTWRLLTEGPPQLSRKATLFTLLDGPRTRMGLKRTTCCLAFRSGDGSTCGACPLRSDREVELAALESSIGEE